MISVIVPVYNGEKYILKILESFESQIMNDFEVIFVDDGSVDESYKLINECKNSGEYSFKIRLFKQENKGVSSARNTGIDNSTGEYLCFVDVDDGISRDFLSHMYYLLDTTQASIVFCKTTPKDDDDLITVEKVNLFSTQEALESYLYHDLVSGACSLMVRSEIIKANNLRFKAGYKYSEDLHMVWRMIHYSEKIAETNKKLYIYRINEGSAMSKFDPSRMDSIKLMEHLEKFFLKENKDFYPLFKKYGKARIAWSILWQAVYNLNFNSFMMLTKTYNFKNELRKLYDFKQTKVKYSSWLFCQSRVLYYLLVKVASRKFRLMDS